MLLERIQEEAMKKSKAYHPDLIENLRDAGEAEEYLNAALEEGDLDFTGVKECGGSARRCGTTRRKGQAQPRKLIQGTL